MSVSLTPELERLMHERIRTVCIKRPARLGSVSFLFELHAVLEQCVDESTRRVEIRPVDACQILPHSRERMTLDTRQRPAPRAGVLDGGDRDVFLGAGRLSRFMETVERTTTAIPGVSGDRVREAKTRREPKPRVGAAAAPPAAASTGDWAALMQSGLAWLEQLAAVSRPSGNRRAEGLRVIHRDPQTGQDYLKIPMPGPDVLDQALRTIGSLLDRFRR